MKKITHIALTSILLVVLNNVLNAKEPVCSDEVFIRRASIAVAGRLPDPQRVKDFLNASNPEKRNKYIDELLDSEAYVSYMSMRWGDILRIKSEFPSNLWPNGAQAYNRWIYENISRNIPYDEFVRKIIISKGSNFRAPAVNFYRAFPVRNAENFYKNIHLLFSGSRKCDLSTAICFSQIRFKSTKEWKEEILYIDNPIDGKSASVRLPDGKTIPLLAGTDWRETYADWLTKENSKQLAAVMVNRMFAWLTGKGIVHEPDDWGDHNPPSDPELLNRLTYEFIASGFDMKKLARSILNSSHFQHATAFKPHRLLAEVLVDALADLTGISDEYRSRVPEPFTFYPVGTRAADLGDGTVSSSVLELFGRSTRDISLESQHATTLTDRQLLYLMNTSSLEQKIRKSPRINTIAQNAATIPALCDELSLLTFSRKATKEEIRIFTDYMQANKLNKRNLANEILWVFINSSEFLYQH